MVIDYTAEQIGDTLVHPINGRTKGRYSLLVVQPLSNQQVVVIEPCDWDAGHKRVQQMVRAGVGPADIRFCWRPDGQLSTDGLPLRPVAEALWWTAVEQAIMERERASVG